jgi:hypothetical protein
MSLVFVFESACRRSYLDRHAHASLDPTHATWSLLCATVLPLRENVRLCSYVMETRLWKIFIASCHDDSSWYGDWSWCIMMTPLGGGVWVFQEWTHTLHNGISSFCSWAHAEHMCIDKRAKPQTCHGQITRTPFETIRSQDYERRSNIVQRLSNTCEKYVPRITIWCSHRVMCNTALSNTCEKYVPRITIRCSHRVRCNTDMHNLLLGFGTPKHLFCLTYMVDTACIWHICCISARRNNMFVWRMWLKLHAFDICVLRIHMATVVDRLSRA